jgi:hypothetical protein
MITKGAISDYSLHRRKKHNTFTILAFAIIKFLVEDIRIFDLE